MTASPMTTWHQMALMLAEAMAEGQPPLIYPLEETASYDELKARVLTIEAGRCKLCGMSTVLPDEMFCGAVHCAWGCGSYWERSRGKEIGWRYVKGWKPDSYWRKWHNALRNRVRRHRQGRR